jgi:hypothetical protein
VPGVAWKDQARVEYADGSLVIIAGTTSVEALGETVTVPLGTLDRAVRIQSVYDVTHTTKGQSRTYPDTIMEWWTPGMGRAKYIEETSLAQHWTMEMISLSAPTPGP